MTTQTYTGTLIVQACCNCGMIFGVAKEYDQWRREDGRSFYCPAGHAQSYSETEVVRQRKRAEKAERDAAYWRDQQSREQMAHQETRNRERAQKAAKTRLKNRIGNGVCPCCKRHFVNVERHIKGQHPDFVA